MFQQMKGGSMQMLWYDIAECIILTHAFRVWFVYTNIECIFIRWKKTVCVQKHSFQFRKHFRWWTVDFAEDIKDIHFLRTACQILTTRRISLGYFLMSSGNMVLHDLITSQEQHFVAPFLQIENHCFRKYRKVISLLET